MKIYTYKGKHGSAWWDTSKMSLATWVWLVLLMATAFTTGMTVGMIINVIRSLNGAFV